MVFILYFLKVVPVEGAEIDDLSFGRYPAQIVLRPE
jgi:hypothetical protein